MRGLIDHRRISGRLLLYQRGLHTAKVPSPRCDGPANCKVDSCRMQNILKTSIRMISAGTPGVGGFRGDFYIEEILVKGHKGRRLG
jgi:hypothetical protein